MSQQIEITLRRSRIRTTPNQKLNLNGLGLKSREKTVVLSDTPAIRGMIQKVIHLVEVRRPEATQSRKKPMTIEINVKAAEAPTTSPAKKTRKTTKKEK